MQGKPLLQYILCLQFKQITYVSVKIKSSLLLIFLCVYNNCSCYVNYHLPIQKCKTFFL